MSGWWRRLGLIRDSGENNGKNAPDNGPLKKLGRWGRFSLRLVWVNLLFMVLSLLIVPFGPACNGLARMMRDTFLRKQLTTDVFWEGVQHRFRQSFLAGIIMAVCTMMALYATRSYFAEARAGSGWFYIPFVISLTILLFTLFLWFYLFLLLTTYNIRLWDGVRHAAKLAVTCLPTNIVALVLTGGVGAFLWNFPFMGITFYTLIGFCYNAFVVAVLCYPNIEKHLTGLRPTGQAAEQDDLIPENK